MNGERGKPAATRQATPSLSPIRLLFRTLFFGSAALAALFLFSRLLSPLVPRTLREQDETIYAASTRFHDLWTSSPQPPGTPLWSFAGRLLDPLIPGDPRRALSTLSLLAAAASLPLLFAFGKRLGSRSIGLSAIVVFAAAPVTIFHAARGFADVPTLPFLLGSLLLASAPEDESRPAAAGILAGIAAGLRPPGAFVLVPGLVASAIGRPRREALRHLTRIAVAGLATSALWLVPLVADSGGFSSFETLLRTRAEHISGKFATEGPLPFLDSFLVLDFGGVALSGIVLSLGIAGALLLRRAERPWRVLVATAIPWTILLVVFQNRTIVRYSVGWAAVVSLLAAGGLFELSRRSRLATCIVAPLLAIALVRSAPGLSREARRDSAPARALSTVTARLAPGRDVLLGESIFWSFFREATWDGRLPVPAREVNDLLPWRDPFPEARKTMLEDRTRGDWQPLGPRALVFEEPNAAARALSQPRLQRIAWDPDGIVFAIGAYEPEIGLFEPPFRWMTGRAFLYLPPADREEVLLLEVDVPPWYREPLRVSVIAPGSDGTRACLLERHLPPGRSTLRAVIPAGLRSPLGSTKLLLETDHSRVPKDRGLGPDDRWLAYRLRSARLVPPESLCRSEWVWRIAEVGRDLSPIRNGLTGFHGREVAAEGSKWFRWASGFASLEIPASVVPSPSAIRLSASGRPGGSRIELVLDGLPAGRVEIPAGWFVDREIPLHGFYRASEGLHVLELHTDVSMKIPGDSRELGVAVERILMR